MYWNRTPALGFRCFLMLIAAVAIGCDGAGQKRGAKAMADTGLTSPRNADPESLAVRAMKTGPLAVVSLYASWDTAGKRICPMCEPGYGRAIFSMECWIPAADCQTDSPGWDVASVVRGYKIRQLSIGDTTASVAVNYSVLAKIVGNSLVLAPASYEWTASLLRMNGKWRFVDPQSQVHPFVSPTAALELVKSASDSAALRKLLAE
jgi:hypothetical protein